MHAFDIGYVKNILNVPKLNENTEEHQILGKFEYDQFRLHNVQNYNPIYQRFFTMTENNFNKIYLNHTFHFINMNTVYDSSTKEYHKTDIFLKFAPLLDPVRYLTGKYNVRDTSSTYIELPVLSSISSSNIDESRQLNPKTGHPLANSYKTKLYDTNNASYIDNFFSYLSSKLLHHHGFVHGIDYYGSFMAIQEKFRINIADDLEYLIQYDYFRKNKGILYEMEDIEDPYSKFGSRANKQKLMISDVNEVSDILGDILDLTEESAIPLFNSSDNHYELQNIHTDILEIDKEINLKTKSECDSECNCISNSKSSESESECDSDSESDSESESESESDSNHLSTTRNSNSNNNSTSTSTCSDSSSNNDSHLAYIYNFPTQIICLEKCEGTLDELFNNNEMDEAIGNAMLMQVIMILLSYQKTFHFTHNDLHTNNIMWKRTEQKYLYYKFNEIVYRVPTYGRIFKLIDFGRSIYKFRGQIFCSDSFSSEGDASTQYNFGPYFNSNKPLLEPNFSFDLCRLATSIYDFILDESSDKEDIEKNADSFQQIIFQWVFDDNNRNILYKKNGEERYPGFKLYKMIARSVHGTKPEDQLKHTIFKSFIYTKKNKKDIVVFDIDNLPDYTLESSI